MNKISSNLKIVIAGIPEGVRTAIFDESKEKSDDKRQIVNSLANSDWIVSKEVKNSFNGIPVCVVIRCSGFLPYQYRTTLEPGIGLFHAARLEIDQVYNGKDSKVPENWNTAQEHRKAEEKIQTLYRQFRKDNKATRRLKTVLDWGGPILGTISGLPFGIWGAIIGLVVGYMVAFIASKFTIKSLGLD